MDSGSAPSSPPAKTHKTDVKLVCLGPQPRTRGPSAPQIPQNPLHPPGAKARLPTTEDASSTDASCGTERRALLPRGRPALPQPRQGEWKRIRSFVFVSWKDSDYRGARACSPDPSAHYPARLERGFLPRGFPLSSQAWDGRGALGRTAGPQPPPVMQVRARR